MTKKQPSLKTINDWVRLRIKTLDMNDPEKILKDIMGERPEIERNDVAIGRILTVSKKLLEVKEPKEKEEKEVLLPGEIEGDIAFDTNIENIHPSIDICRLGLIYGVWLPIETYNSEVSVVSDVRWIGSKVCARSHLEEEEVTLRFDLPVGMRRRISLNMIKDIEREDTSAYLGTSLTTLTTLINEKCSVVSDVDVDICDLLANMFRYYVDFKDDDSYLLLPLWNIGTYLFILFKTYPYISLYGFEASGKSKTIEISSIITFNGQKSVGISPAALYRGTQMLRWTLFVDEAGLFKKRREVSKRLAELLPLVLEGYKNSSVVPRVGSKEKGYPLEYFEVFCPKMFADTNEFDWILGSRAIQIVMRPTKRGSEIGSREMDESDTVWQEIRDYLYLFAIQNWQKIKEIYDNLENNTKLKDREWELFKPLLSIAKFFSNDKFNKLLEFAEKYAKDREKEKATIRTEYQIIKAIVDLGIFNEWLDIKKIREKVEEYVGSHDWLNNRWIGKVIKKFNLPCRKRRISKGVEYMFKEEDLQDIIDRFGLQTLFEDNGESEDEELKGIEQIIEGQDKGYGEFKNFIKKSEKGDKND